MDLVTAVQRELVRDTSGLLAVLDEAGVPILGSSTAYPKWVWRTKPWQQVEGTGKAGIVLNQRGTWVPPSELHTAQRPRLLVEIYCDATRRSDRQILKQDAEEKSLQLFDAVSKVLHRPQGGTIYFDALRIHASVRLGEPDIVDVPEGDYMVRLSCYFGVSLDGAAAAFMPSGFYGGY